MVHDGQVDQIISNGSDLSAYELEPQLVTALFDAEQRSKREMVKYNDIPPMMVQAVLAIEDRRFFEHSGVNFLRMAEAAWIDVIRGRHDQGGSTLTMQLSRGFFLTPEKTIKRKLTEMLIAEELEQKFSKTADFRFLCELGGLGAERIVLDQRIRRGVEGLLQQGTERHHAARGCAAGRIDSASQLSVALPASGARHGAPEPGAGVDGGDARHYARAGG